MVVTNSKVGSSGGYSWSESGGQLTKLKVWERKWLDKGSKGGVTAVQLTIGGNEKDAHGDTKSGPESTDSKEISFSSDEKVTSMSIWAGTWVDRIKIVTDKQTFEIEGMEARSIHRVLDPGNLSDFRAIPDSVLIASAPFLRVLAKRAIGRHPDGPERSLCRENVLGLGSMSVARCKPV